MFTVKTIKTLRQAKLAEVVLIYGIYFYPLLNVVLFSFDNIHEDEFSVFNSLNYSVLNCVSVFIKGNDTCCPFKSFGLSKGITDCCRFSGTCTFDGIKNKNVGIVTKSGNSCRFPVRIFSLKGFKELFGLRSKCY